MRSKRQFQTAAKRRTFYDRKVLRYGYSATVSMGRIIPKTWQYVRVRIIEQTDKHITVEFEKLLGDEMIAPITQAHKSSRQNP